MITTRSESGSSLLEFSLIVPVVALMFLGVVDFGIAIAQSMTVCQAAQVGAQYGTVVSRTTDDSTAMGDMVQAATIAANGMPGFTAASKIWYSCSPNGAAVSPGSTCPSYGFPIKYVQVKTSASVSVLARFPGLPGSIALTGFAALRAK